MKRILSMMIVLILCLSLCACLMACENDGNTDDEDTTAGDTTVGDTTAGETVAPGTTAPETTAPETQAPDTTAPETTAPDTTAPETQAPDTTAPETTAPDTTTPDINVGVGEEVWEDMLTESKLENYTLLTEGNMTTVQDGQSYGPYKTKSVCKMTADKMALILYDAESDAPIPGNATEVFEGEIAEAQRVQYSQLFVNILAEYDNFTYDAEKGIYQIDELTVWSGTIKGISMTEGETPQLFDVPCTIEIRNAEATLSEDGKLLSLTCDYTQSMTIDEEEITVFGVTTWTFTNYGTTVIE